MAAEGGRQINAASFDGLGEMLGSLPADPFLVVCVTVRDEQDILDAFLAFHLSQGVDLILAFDHASQDGSRAILDWYAANEPVVYFHDEGPKRYQGTWMTGMARLAASAGASWVINADADEFWMPRFGTLRDVFRALPDDVSWLRAFPQDFLPPRSGGGFDFEAQTVWDASGNATYYMDKLKPKTAHRASETAVVHSGNHSVTGIEGSMFGGVLVDILHFPVRSFEQFERKIVVRFVRPDGSMISPTGKLGTYPGQHYRQFNERRVSGGLRGDFEAWLSMAGISEERFPIDDRLARHMGGLREVGMVSPKVSPGGFAQPPEGGVDSSYVVSREVRLFTSMMRGHTRQMRGQLKELRAQVKELRGQVKDLGRQLKEARHSLRTMDAPEGGRGANDRRRRRLPAWIQRRASSSRRGDSP